MMTKTRKMPLILVLIMLLTMVVNPLTVFGQGVELSSDIENSWAKDQIRDWVDKGLISGYPDGTFRPNNNITRGEFVAIINSVFGYKDLAETTFKDVSEDKWYYDEVSKAKLAGYISGYDGNIFKPDYSISRQEVAKVIYNLLGLENKDSKNALESFEDYADVPNWSKEYLNAVVAEGYMGGYPDGTCRPKQPITRAEAVVMLDRVVGELIDMEGTYGTTTERKVIEGNVTINTDDVTLQNTLVRGDLYLAAGIGEGEVDLDNVTVEGRTIVNGGGENSIIVNNSTINEMIVLKITGRVRVVSKGDTNVTKVIVQSGAKLEEDRGNGKAKGHKKNDNGFGDVEILTIKPGENVELIGGFDDVSVKSSSTVTVGEETTVEKLETSSEFEGTIIDVREGANLEELVLNATTEVKGKGTIKMSVINKEGSNVEQEIEEYQLSEDVKVVVIGGNEVTESKGSEDENTEDEATEYEDTSGDTSNEDSSSENTGGYTPTPDPEPTPIPVGEPDPANSGIINIDSGSNGSKEIYVTIEVKDSNGQAITNYTGEDFTVIYPIYYANQKISKLNYENRMSLVDSFTNNGDGTYTVMLDYFYEEAIDKLIVDNVVIEDSTVPVKMAEDLAEVTSIPADWTSYNYPPDVIEGIVNIEPNKTVSQVYISLYERFTGDYVHANGSVSQEEAWFPVQNTGNNYNTWNFTLTEAQKQAMEQRSSWSIQIKVNDGTERIGTAGWYNITKRPPGMGDYRQLTYKDGILNIGFRKPVKISRFMSSNTDFSNLIGPNWGSATISPEYNINGYSPSFNIVIKDDTELTDNILIRDGALEDIVGNLQEQEFHYFVPTPMAELSVELGYENRVNPDIYKVEVEIETGVTVGELYSVLSIDSNYSSSEWDMKVIDSQGQEITNLQAPLDDTMKLKVLNDEYITTYNIKLQALTSAVSNATFIIGDKLYSSFDTSGNYNLLSFTINDTVTDAVYNTIYTGQTGNIGIFTIDQGDIDGADYTATLNSTGTQYESIMLSTTTVTDAVYSEVYSYVYYGGTNDLSFEVNNDYIVTDLNNQVPSNATPLLDGDTVTVNYNGSVLFEAVWDGITKVWKYISN